MTRNTKIILGIVAGLVVLCLIACGAVVLGFTLLGRNVAQGVKSDPTQASQTGQEIARFDLPAGYQARSSMDFLGIRMVFYENTQDSSNMIILLQMPISGELNQSTIEQMQQAMERQSGRGLSDLKTIESKTITVRGQPAQMIVQEGVNGENVTYRQELVAFQGSHGLAMLTVVGPASTWDQAAYDKMVQSIR